MPIGVEDPDQTRRQFVLNSIELLLDSGPAPDALEAAADASRMTTATDRYAAAVEFAAAAREAFADDPTLRKDLTRRRPELAKILPLIYQTSSRLGKTPKRPARSDHRAEFTLLGAALKFALAVHEPNQLRQNPPDWLQRVEQSRELFPDVNKYLGNHKDLGHLPRLARQEPDHFEGASPLTAAQRIAFTDAEHERLRRALSNEEYTRLSGILTEPRLEMLSTHSGIQRQRLIDQLVTMASQVVDPNLVSHGPSKIASGGLDLFKARQVASAGETSFFFNQATLSAFHDTFVMLRDESSLLTDALSNPENKGFATVLDDLRALYPKSLGRLINANQRLSIAIDKALVLVPILTPADPRRETGDDFLETLDAQLRAFELEFERYNAAPASNKTAEAVYNNAAERFAEFLDNNAEDVFTLYRMESQLPEVQNVDFWRTSQRVAALEMLSLTELRQRLDVAAEAPSIANAIQSSRFPAPYKWKRQLYIVEAAIEDEWGANAIDNEVRKLGSWMTEKQTEVLELLDATDPRESTGEMTPGDERQRQLRDRLDALGVNHPEVTSTMDAIRERGFETLVSLLGEVRAAQRAVAARQSDPARLPKAVNALVKTIHKREAVVRPFLLLTDNPDSNERPTPAHWDKLREDFDRVSSIDAIDRALDEVRDPQGASWRAALWDLEIALARRPELASSNNPSKAITNWTTDVGNHRWMALHEIGRARPDVLRVMLGASEPARYRAQTPGMIRDRRLAERIKTISNHDPEFGAEVGLMLRPAAKDTVGLIELVEIANEVATPVLVDALVEQLRQGIHAEPGSVRLALAPDGQRPDLSGPIRDQTDQIRARLPQLMAESPVLKAEVAAIQHPSGDSLTETVRVFAAAARGSASQQGLADQLAAVIHDNGGVTKMSALIRGARTNAADASVLATIVEAGQFSTNLEQVLTSMDVRELGRGNQRRQLAAEPSTRHEIVQEPNLGYMEF